MMVQPTTESSTNNVIRANKEKHLARPIHPFRSPFPFSSSNNSLDRNPVHYDLLFRPRHNTPKSHPELGRGWEWDFPNPTISLLSTVYTLCLARL